MKTAYDLAAQQRLWQVSEEMVREANPFGHKPVDRWPEGIECSSPW